MLQIDVVIEEEFNEEDSSFITKTYPVYLEHSLVSLSKWESKYEKPFLAQDQKTEEQVLDYVSMMVLNEVPTEIFLKITNEQFQEINQYITSKMSATWFNEPETAKRNSQVVTSELIYYWMTSYQIPWEAERWHLNRLFTLIRVFNAEKSAVEKPKKARTEGLAAQRRALNEQRKKELKTSG